MKYEKGDPVAAPSFAVISEDIRAVDPKAWTQLVDDLPPHYASQAISDAASELAIDDDVAGAIELEKKSLALGGWETEFQVAESIFEDDQAAASKLFDQILSTAAKTDSDPMLLARIVQRAFEAKPDQTASGFYSEERKQSILAAITKQLNSDQQDRCYYASVIEDLASRVKSPTLEQVRATLEDCVGHLEAATNAANRVSSTAT